MQIIFSVGQTKYVIVNIYLRNKNKRQISCALDWVAANGVARFISSGAKVRKQLGGLAGSVVPWAMGRRCGNVVNNNICPGRAPSVADGWFGDTLAGACGFCGEVSVVLHSPPKAGTGWG